MSQIFKVQTCYRCGGDLVGGMLQPSFYPNPKCKNEGLTVVTTSKKILK